MADHDPFRAHKARQLGTIGLWWWLVAEGGGESGPYSDGERAELESTDDGLSWRVAMADELPNVLGEGPMPTVAAQTAQDAFSGPPAGLTPDPPAGPSGAQDSEQGWGAQAWEATEAIAEVLKPVPGYPCRLSSCGQVLASPGALGGHMAAHRKRGELG